MDPRPRRLSAPAALRTGVAVLACACATAPGDGGQVRTRTAPGLIWDVAAARPLDEAALRARLVAQRFVLLGEKHDNAEHHRLEARVLRELAAAGRRPVVVFEMLSTDVAPALARVLASPRPTAAALREAVAWDSSGWPAWELYAPVFEAALDAHLPVAAGGLSGAALGALRAGGLGALDPGLRARLGLGQPAPAAQREALAEDIRESHCDFAPEAAIPRMVDVQLARDAQLAAALMQGARDDPDGAVLVAGNGHARLDWGVPYWLRSAGEGPAMALAFVEVPLAPANPARDLEERFDLPRPFDVVWYTPRVDDLDPCVKFRQELERMRQHGRSGS